jgi:hypothetical protein
MEEDLELEGEAPPPAPRPRPKVFWNVRLPADLSKTLRRIAAINGVSISQTLTYLLQQGFDMADYPPLPKGTYLSMVEHGQEIARSRYFVTAELDDAFKVLESGGYSPRVVMEIALRKGLVNAKKRRHTKERETVDTTPVPASPARVEGQGSLPMDSELPESPEDGI